MATLTPEPTLSSLSTGTDALRTLDIPAPAHGPSAAELRHITSTTHLTSPARERKLSNRTSGHLRTHRLGSRSPASIPSSPTSVHSSSSAIFERDIEPIASPLPHSSDPHHIPRAKFTEEIERAIPSVLDSAAAVLTSNADDDDLDAVSIVTPAPMEPAGYQSGFTSPISRLSSRSPSPSGGNRRSLLFSNSLPGSPPRPVQGSPPSRPVVHTNSLPLAPLSAPQSTTTPTPSSAYFSTASESESNSSSPTTATHTEHPLHGLTNPLQLTAIPIPSALGSHPPSPKIVNKRLSFISYMDLLSSTPASAIPLSTLTSAAMVSEPPPHIPSVIGHPQAQYAASSSAGSVHGAPAYVLERDAVTDDVGGEWEREGLGKGLEERLEGLMAATTVPSKA